MVKHVTCEVRLPCRDPDSFGLGDLIPLGLSLLTCRMDHRRSNFMEMWPGRVGGSGEWMSEQLKSSLNSAWPHYVLSVLALIRCALLQLIKKAFVWQLF